MVMITPKSENHGKVIGAKFRCFSADMDAKFRWCRNTESRCDNVEIFYVPLQEVIESEN